MAQRRGRSRRRRPSPTRTRGTRRPEPRRRHHHRRHRRHRPGPRDSPHQIHCPCLTTRRTCDAAPVPARGGRVLPLRGERRPRAARAGLEMPPRALRSAPRSDGEIQP